MKFYNFAKTDNVFDYYYDTGREAFTLGVGNGDIVIRVDAHLAAQEIDVFINSVLGA